MARILIVDDDPATRVLMNSILGEGLGHELVFAQDGETAIQRYGRLAPDLVITDLVMPKMHGVLVVEHLRKTFPLSTIIAISGKAPEQLARAGDAGAVATLTKPIQRDELVRAVREALKGAREGDPWRGAR
jgi:CheY-like chemotaxis protein